MLAYELVLQLLWLVLHNHFLAADFQFAAELVAVGDYIVEQQLPSSTVLNPHLCVGLNWLTYQRRGWTVGRQDAPYSVVVGFGTKANLSISGEASIDLGRELARVQV